MSELVGRFLSFEDQMGRGLVRFVYYVLLFLLVVTTLWEIVTTAGKLGDDFWHNLWDILVIIPLSFLVKLLLLRVGAELVMAVLSIDDHLQGGMPEGDVMSSGLNVAARRGAPVPQPAQPDPQPATDEAQDGDGPPAKPATKKRAGTGGKKAARKTAKTASKTKTASRKTAKKASGPSAARGSDTPASPQGETRPSDDQRPSDAPKTDPDASSD